MATIIVGSGITGLYLARELAKKGTRVILIEKAKILGGRIHTIHGLEAGAGRIHSSHTKILGLINEYGLKTIKIDNGSKWRSLGSSASTPNHFEPAWAAFLDQVRKLSPDVLGSSTLRGLAEEILGPVSAKALLDMFPYRTELESMRADVAILGFDRVVHGDYYVVAGGLSRLVDAMVTELESLGVEIRKGVKVVDADGTSVKTRAGFQGPLEVVEGSRVILCMPAADLRKLPVMRGFKTLDYLGMAPLIRIYAKWPVPWPYSEKIVTDSPLRFIIPINPAEGIVMISYTDGRDTKRWAGLSGPALTQVIVQEVRRLFPERVLPEPEWVTSYDWSEGTTYWVPGGSYDPIKESEGALQPRPATMPELYVCGESFSLLQAWIEGSLEHAGLLLSRL